MTTSNDEMLLVLVALAFCACGTPVDEPEERPTRSYNCSNGIAASDGQPLVIVQTIADATSFAETGCTEVPLTLLLCEGATGPMTVLRSVGTLLMDLEQIDFQAAGFECPDAGSSKNLEGLEGLTNAGAVRIGHTQLETLNGLSSLTQVGDFLDPAISIADNSDLRDVTGLNGVVTMRGGVCIERNPNVPQEQIDALTQRFGGCPPPCDPNTDPNCAPP